MRPVRASVTKASVNKKQRILFKPREWVEAAAQLGFTITATVLSIFKQLFDIDFFEWLKVQTSFDRQNVRTLVVQILVSVKKLITSKNDVTGSINKMEDKPDNRGVRYDY